jgi:CHAT domain-containing protein
MQLHQLHPVEGLDAAALEAAERARGRSLLEILTEAEIDIRQGVDSALVEDERRLQQQLNTRAERLTRLLSSKHTQDDSLKATKELQALLTQFQEIQAQIRAASSSYAALTQPQPLNLQEIQQQVLDDNTMLMEYALGEERSFLWAVTPTTIASFELPKRAEIDSLARRVYGLLTVRNTPVSDENDKERQARLLLADAEYQQAAAALSRMVLGPMASQLGAKRLLIVSDGALQYIPYAALPIPAANGEEGSEPKPPLVAEHEIISLPSASVMAALRRELAERRSAPKTVAVLADPVFFGNDPRVKGSEAQHQKNGSARSEDSRDADLQEMEFKRALRDFAAGDAEFQMPRLLFSRREAEGIVRLAPAEASMKALDFAANRAAAMSSELSQYRIVHFATHGLLNSANPELSGIVLSLVDEKGQPQNGFLRLNEIYNLSLSADLVVLSACQTALGKEIKGEGLVGLTRGFMYAGAARVVASLWNVQDDATAELMKRFYAKMLGEEKLRPAAALRYAQIEMWKTKLWQAPYYWAGFVLQGEWR